MSVCDCDPPVPAYTSPDMKSCCSRVVL